MSFCKWRKINFFNLDFFPIRWKKKKKRLMHYYNRLISNQINIVIMLKSIIYNSSSCHLPCSQLSPYKTLQGPARRFKVSSGGMHNCLYIFWKLRNYNRPRCYTNIAAVTESDSSQVLRPSYVPNSICITLLNLQ